MKQTFYSNGKLLITGEYVVLDGAKALALPTKFGQDLVVEKDGHKEIRWTSYDMDGSVWFEETIPFDAIANNATTENQPERNTLVAILHAAYLVNPDFLKSEGYNVTTHLGFPKNWGLGTSSTLINNIAQWLRIEAFTLLKSSFGGSGYDIACAQQQTPIVYQLLDGEPKTTNVDFSPECIENLYFVYLNQKQNSKAAIAFYSEKQNEARKVIPAINLITETILETSDFESFTALLENHEIIISEILEIETVKKRLFADFDGTVKSLGAWGGDFVLAVSKENPTAYFREKGFETVVPYREMIL
jgi:mevalonate kinase